METPNGEESHSEGGIPKGEERIERQEIRPKSEIRPKEEGSCPKAAFGGWKGQNRGGSIQSGQGQRAWDVSKSQKSKA